MGTSQPTSHMKTPKNHGAPWSAQEIKQLKQEAQGNMPTRVMGLKHGRTPQAIQAKASQEGISLRPNNQSPYGTGK